MVGIALVGFGYWGPNLARNFASCPGCRLIAICDPGEAQRAAALARFPGCLAVAEYEQILSHPQVDAVAIATPTSSHFVLARDALLADKDVLVEKPLTQTAAQARVLVELARERRRILAVDHTFLFADAVAKIKEIIDSGEIGKLLYIDSVRTNLGLFQRDHNVIFDLAPHEFSMVNHWLTAAPISVRAMGACHAQPGIENLAYIHVAYGDNLVAHFHLNWLAPVKIRQTIVAGSRKMIVYDDMERSEKIKIYDKGIAFSRDIDRDALHRAIINYRSGDMVAPHLPNREPLTAEIEHFVKCVATRSRPLADGSAGLRVVELLEAAQWSLDNDGRAALLAPPFESSPLRSTA